MTRYINFTIPPGSAAGPTSQITDMGAINLTREDSTCFSTNPDGSITVYHSVSRTVSRGGNCTVVTFVPGSRSEYFEGQPLGQTPPLQSNERWHRTRSRTPQAVKEALQWSLFHQGAKAYTSKANRQVTLRRPRQRPPCKRQCPLSDPDPTGPMPRKEARMVSV